MQPLVFSVIFYPGLIFIIDFLLVSYKSLLYFVTFRGSAAGMAISIGVLYPRCGVTKRCIEGSSTAIDVVYTELRLYEHPGLDTQCKLVEEHTRVFLVCC